MTIVFRLKLFILNVFQYENHKVNKIIIQTHTLYQSRYLIIENLFFIYTYRINTTLINYEILILISHKISKDNLNLQSDLYIKLKLLFKYFKKKKIKNMQIFKLYKMYRDLSILNSLHSTQHKKMLRLLNIKYRYNIFLIVR